MLKFRSLIVRVLPPLILCLLSFRYWRADEEQLQSTVSENKALQRNSLVYAIFLNKNMPLCKALDIIGTIQKDRQVRETTALPLIHVFGRDLTPSSITRLLLYQRVIYQDINLCFPDLVISSLDGSIMVNEKDWSKDEGELFHKTILVRLLTDFENMALLLDFPPRIDIEQQLNEYGHIHFARNGAIVAKAVRCYESLHFEPKILDVSDSELAKGSICTGLMRVDPTQWIHLHNLSGIGLRKSIFLGVPTTSKRTHIMRQHPLLTILLPSLHDTCKSNLDLNFTLLVAYDQGDKYLDNEREMILKLLDINKPENLQIVLVRLPFLGSVTMIWNLLYEIAMSRGAKYFYQLNDDIKFHSHSWPKQFTEWIDANEGFGLTGPLDEAFPDCSLMTQNFIGRRHHDVFGFVFPPDLPNWWSDDWLNRVYDCIGRKKCFNEIRISNGNRRDGENPRYHACPYLPSHELLVAHFCESARLKLRDFV